MKNTGGGRLKYGFGFRAELRPGPRRLARPRGGCCPELANWNSSTVAGEMGSQLLRQGRRLMMGGLAGMRGA